MIQLVIAGAIALFFLVSVSSAYITGTRHGVTAEKSRISTQTDKLNRDLALIAAVNSGRIKKQDGALNTISGDLKALIAVEPEPVQCPEPVEAPVAPVDRGVEHARGTVPVAPLAPLERKVYVRVCDYSPALRGKLNEINRR